jgi:hypothetical protein|tara:strand:+ start:6247 stop:6897 length:651 start_codon:yes stop_codon:yes gene_type:complete
MKHNDFIGHYENVMDVDACDAVISLFDSNWQHPDDPNNKLRTGQGNTETERGHLNRHDYQWYLDPSPSFDLIVRTVEYCWEQYKQTFWVSNYVHINFDEVKLQKTFPRGGFHDWHCEITDLGAVDRCVAWMLYLNDIPEGEGETEFLWQGRRVQPKAGTMLIWPAFYTHVHRGNTVYSKSKYIATGWGNYFCNDSQLEDYFEHDDNLKLFTDRKRD